MRAPATMAGLDRTLLRHRSVHIQPSRRQLIEDVISQREAIVTTTGALACWFSKEETGRIPQDTYTVDHGIEHGVDWSMANNRRMSPATFDKVFRQALTVLTTRKRLYVTDRSVGADPQFSVSVRTITESPLASLFSDTMFRPSSERTHASTNGFTLLAVPTVKLRTEGLELKNNMLIAMDFERRLGVVFGTRYLGAIKKLMFTAMNHLLPEEGVLPLHCSAIEDLAGDTHVFLGLSGTGKTTLSSAPGFTLIGDDEHLWSEQGIANMEYGCYAKLAHLSQEKEPEIFGATFGVRPTIKNGVIIENALAYPDGTVDCSDLRLAENSRAAYPLSYLDRAKPSARGGHPKTMLFLTADATGVLPPIARLPVKEALRWFELGYTCKIAGTETGVLSPTPTFSRFFGGAFMPRRSEDYVRLLQKRLLDHGTDVYLVNTGWSGGPIGVGRRMDIDVTRKLVENAISGTLKEVQYNEEKRFHFLVPRECPGVDRKILDPQATWPDWYAYDAAAARLAADCDARI